MNNAGGTQQKRDCSNPFLEVAGGTQQKNYEILWVVLMTWSISGLSESSSSSQFGFGTLDPW